MLTWFSRPFFLYLVMVFLLAYHLYHVAIGVVSGVGGLIDGSGCRNIGP